MSRDIWELRVEGKESGFEKVIRTFDSKRAAMEFIYFSNAVRLDLADAVGEPINLWLYHFKQLATGERLNG